jgi:phosphatidylglycerol:prolipoprotein diacylglycerol transferase
VIGLFALLYAPVRFGLDFLRATDVARPDERYAGLTPAQWACMLCLGVGIWLFTRQGDAGASPPTPGPDGDPKPAVVPETPSSGLA